MASESVAIELLHAEDRRRELHIKAEAILRVMRAAAFNQKDPPGDDDLANAAWVVEGMLSEIDQLGGKLSDAVRSRKDSQE